MSIERSRRATALAALALLAGCGAGLPLREPLPYSPNFSRVGVGAHGRSDGVVRKGYDTAAGGGAARSAALVPDACVTPDLGADPLYLPPGCANNLNLQMMVEREDDLLHGRSTGPAMAAPVARAARRYIDEEPRRSEVPQPVAADTTGADG